MDPIEQLSYILPTLTAVVDRIEPGQLGDATPCANFSVRDVLDHMMVGGGTFAYVFRGEDPPEVTAPDVGDRVPVAEFRKAMDDLLAAVKSPGAMERTINAPFGEVPGSVFASFVAFDGLIHGWDLATSTKQNYQVPPAVISSVDEFARNALGPDMRDGDTFKDETPVPEGADQLERLVAFSGRSL